MNIKLHILWYISKYIVTYFSIYESGNSLCIIQYIIIYLHNILFCIISNIEIYVMSINILTIRIFGNIFSLHKGMLSEKQSTWKQATITTSSLVRNLGVIFEDQLTFKDHIAKTAWSCRFALHNIRKIRHFLTEHAAQLLVQAPWA